MSFNGSISSNESPYIPHDFESREGQSHSKEGESSSVIGQVVKKIITPEKKENEKDTPLPKLNQMNKNSHLSSQEIRLCTFLLKCWNSASQLGDKAAYTLAERCLVGKVSFAELQGLSELNLSGLQLKALPDEISLLKGIIILDLTSNELTDFPPGFEQLKQLASLLLAGNPIEIFPEVLKKLPKLSNLDLYQTKLSLLPVDMKEVITRFPTKYEWI